MQNKDFTVLGKWKVAPFPFYYQNQTLHSRSNTGTSEGILAKTVLRNKNVTARDTFFLITFNLSESFPGRRRKKTDR